jgi:glycosyltransferase involved in cell wall biosynthesis
MKFSVIVPAYNAEKYIRTAIDSCLAQTYAAHEIIVIDDASTDGTAAIAESYPAPVKVIRLGRNSGVSVARNRGAEVATGDWLAFLDADDWFLPVKLELQRRCAAENALAVLIYAGFLRSVGGKEVVARFTPPTFLAQALRYRCAIHTSTVVLSRRVFDSVEGFDHSLVVGEDWDLWLKLAAHYSTKAFAAIPQPLAVYRASDGGLTANANRLFQTKASLVEKRCLYETAGLSKNLWRRKILAFQYYDASIALREERSRNDFRFMLQSIALWPFRWSEMPRRYKIAAVMSKQHLFRYLSRSSL